MSILDYTQAQLQALSKADIKNLVGNLMYENALIFERLENAGIVHGNGHHMAQEMARKAQDMIDERWR